MVAYTAVIHLTGSPGLSRTTVESICDSAAEAEWDRFFVAAAYATDAGLSQLVGALSDCMPEFDSLQKSFIVGFDFGLTEPRALERLRTLPNSTCAIYGARAALDAGLRPGTRFHPKVYSFARASQAAGVIGSGNLTAAGMLSNVELGVQFHVSGERVADKKWIADLGTCQRV